MRGYLDILATLANPGRVVVVYADGSALLVPMSWADAPLEVFLPEISE